MEISPEDYHGEHTWKIIKHIPHSITTLDRVNLYKKLNI